MMPAPTSQTHTITATSFADKSRIDTPKERHLARETSEIKILQDIVKQVGTLSLI